MTLNPGTKIDGYEILGPLGAGGMGEVYRARDATLKRDVAIKVLPEYWARDPERLRRFEREAQATAALNHPNIVSIFHVGQFDGSPYIVTELLQGESLRERLRKGPMRLREVLDHGVELARGLAAAHDAGIVHRDLKPENIWVTKDGRIKILDFGLAKLDPTKAASTDAETVSLEPQSHPGQVLGTVGYMSPEQVRGQPADARSDIFAVGVILYEMLTGKAAFRKATSAETMTAILNEDPPAVSQTLAESAAGLAEDREPLPGEEPGEAFPACVRPGVRVGSAVGIGKHVGCGHRPRPALALDLDRSDGGYRRAGRRAHRVVETAARRSGGGVGDSTHRRWRTQTEQSSHRWIADLLQRRAQRKLSNRTGLSLRRTYRRDSDRRS